VTVKRPCEHDAAVEWLCEQDAAVELMVERGNGEFF
jgi:hypothetical protein